MKLTETGLPGVFALTPQRFTDQRGFFQEIYHAGQFAGLGIADAFVQDNHSRSVGGTLRGLHFQHPHPQGKLVRVIRGAIFDVAVDIRRDSPHFGQWVGMTLTEENGTMLWVPPGFAHGFCVISDQADVVYKCTALYSPADERVIAWNDPRLAIDWPVDRPLLSARDAAAGGLEAISDLPFCDPP